jgi:hypothetical protein
MSIDQLSNSSLGKVAKAVLGEFMTLPGVMNFFSVVVLVVIYRGQKGEALQQLQELQLMFPTYTPDQEIVQEYFRKAFLVNCLLIGVIVFFLIGSFVMVYRYVERKGYPILEYLLRFKELEKDTTTE